MAQPGRHGAEPAAEVELADPPAGQRSSADDEAPDVELVVVERDLVGCAPAELALHCVDLLVSPDDRQQVARLWLERVRGHLEALFVPEPPEADRAAVPGSELLEAAAGLLDEHRADDERRRRAELASATAGPSEQQPGGEQWQDDSERIGERVADDRLRGQLLEAAVALERLDRRRERRRARLAARERPHRPRR